MKKLCFNIMSYTYKDLLQTQNILSGIETMQTAIYLFPVNNILGHINTLTKVTIS